MCRRRCGSRSATRWSTSPTGLHRATSPTCPTSWALSSTSGRSPSTRTRSTAPTRPRHRRHRRWHLRRLGRLLRPPDDPRDQGRHGRVLPHRVLRPDPVGPRLPGRRLRRGAGPDGAVLPLWPDRLDHRPGPSRRSPTPPKRLRFAAGNFYVNDKPTGAVVGQQPFGGGRASGTNDKAGAAQNLLRWTSVRSIKETFVPPTNHAYPHMG